MMGKFNFVEGLMTTQDIFNKFKEVVNQPINDAFTESIKDVISTISSHAAQTVVGRFQKSLSFTISELSNNGRMQEMALYDVLSKYNNFTKLAKLSMHNYNTGNRNEFELVFDDGCHSVRYKKWQLILLVETKTFSHRDTITRKYTFIAYDLNNEFIKSFKEDFTEAYKAIFKPKDKNNFIDVYSYTIPDDDISPTLYTFKIPKRNESTLYLSKKLKNKIFKSIDSFIANKEYYDTHSIPWNFKILLYGPPGTGKDTIAKVIASKYNRTLIYLNTGKNTPFVLSNTEESIYKPLILLSDIDRWPYLINNDPNVSDDERTESKSIYGEMINALDGMTSISNDKIIIITTNNIDLFSPSFIRPGRIDLLLEIGYVDKEVFKKYYKDHFHEELPDDITVKDEVTVSAMQVDVLAGMDKNEFLMKYVK